jgi:hypothetical protein
MSPKRKRKKGATVSEQSQSPPFDQHDGLDIRPDTPERSAAPTEEVNDLHRGPIDREDDIRFLRDDDPRLTRHEQREKRREERREERRDD